MKTRQKVTFLLLENRTIMVISQIFFPFLFLILITVSIIQTMMMVLKKMMMRMVLMLMCQMKTTQMAQCHLRKERNAVSCFPRPKLMNLSEDFDSSDISLLQKENILPTCSALLQRR